MKPWGHDARWAGALAPWIFFLITACASAPVFNQIPEGDYRERIQTQESDRIRVSAAVPSAKESEALFGRRLYREGIQPVWLEIENRRETSVTFLPVGLDPEYYSPLEVASLGAGNQRSSEALVDRFFIDQSIDLMIDPGEALSGFVFTKLDEGTKAFNVDISGRDAEADRPTFDTFTFFIPVPGLNIDHYTVDWRNLYAEDEWVEPDKDRLFEEIEKYVCCVTDKSGKNTGDPLNLILIGMPKDIYTAFIRAGWDETEAITKGTMWKTVRSFFSGGEYRYSPISSLYVFGRPQDVAFQKARENIHERNHLRLWMSRVTYQGLPVWIGQISRDIGVRFTAKTITTHKIDPDVDETREYLLENLAYAQSLKAFGYVRGVGEVSPDSPRGNLTGDPWFTDGYRLVLWVSPKPSPISELQFMHWRMPPFSREHER